MITISGTLTNPSGAPLPFLSIFVKAVQSVPGADAIPEASLVTYQTSSTGAYSFTLEDGVYTISISGSGLAQGVSLGQAVVNASSVDTDLITLVNTSGVPTSTIMAAIVTASQDAATTVEVGTTTTVAAGTPASVTNVGTPTALVLGFSIPQGTAGTNGTNGTNGTAATVSIGTTTTGAAGSNATVTNTGTASAAILDFTIPQGEQGATGDIGTAGSTIQQPILVGEVETQVTNTASGTAATLNQASGGVQALTLTGNCTLTLSPSTGAAGVTAAMTIILTQDSTGSRTVTWPTGTIFTAGSAPTLSTTAGQSDIFVAFLLAGSSNWVVAVIAQGQTL